MDKVGIKFEIGDSVAFTATSKFYSKFGTYLGAHGDNAAKVKLHKGFGENIIYPSVNSLVKKTKEANNIDVRFKNGDMVIIGRNPYSEKKGIFEGMDDKFAKVRMIEDGQVNYKELYLLTSVNDYKDMVFFTRDNNKVVYLNYGPFKLPIPEDVNFVVKDNVTYISYNGYEYVISQQLT
ncbi:Hypothetical protein ORPV_545 [Orpheovirus IHUMI-LCC2]|uniref:Uncharacterized protein n=1 Tax=Orpheovirus IHUMI-LCC2 TaxID=2023057 RepID=A0A2I2L4R0_9VIRU|nr:Hypothetical protein ORPV_545 [Orpheovirus IHUMI-LCC2]SNW62449.1 Hypothetical protein ORPV_545 [Orpheovirus IHUMI-LCC2]